MKILVVSSLTRISAAIHVVRALRRAGHSVLAMSDVPESEVDVVCGPDPDVSIVCAAREFVPDFALFIEGGTKLIFPIGLESLPCPTAWYALDSHTDYPEHVAISQLFDVTFVAHKQFVEPLRAAGARLASWLPLAFPANMLPDKPEPRTIDIAFVGWTDPDARPGRTERLAALASVAKTSCIGRADPDEMIRRYSRAKIVFNQSLADDLNMRYFEAMGAGSVLLTDVAVGSGADELFEPERHFIHYRDPDDMMSKFKALLADPQRCAAIGDAAQKAVLARHTYDHRAAAIVERMRGVEKSIRPNPAGYLAAFGALNMPAASLRAAASEFARMGRRTRIFPLNRGISMLLRIMAAILGPAIPIMRALGRLVLRL